VTSVQQGHTVHDVISQHSSKALHFAIHGAAQDCEHYTCGAGFKDPFDPVKTVTLDHPGYRLFGHGLVKGKLDWLLLRRLRPVATDVGNHDYTMSDHKLLYADVVLE
jgi:hypothetical protein